MDISIIEGSKTHKLKETQTGSFLLLVVDFTNEKKRRLNKIRGLATLLPNIVRQN
jgi:hypothetical protein